jgi:hypothetical protein
VPWRWPGAEPSGSNLVEDATFFFYRRERRGRREELKPAKTKTLARFFFTAENPEDAEKNLNRLKPRAATTTDVYSAAGQGVRFKFKTSPTP